MPGGTGFDLVLYRKNSSVERGYPAPIKTFSLPAVAIEAMKVFPSRFPLGRGEFK